MRIYVGNVSVDTTKEQLQDAFAAHGEVTEVNIITDRYSGEARGFAFVEMPDVAQGNAAIEALNGADLGGQPLTVNEARPRRNDGGGGGGRRGGGGGGGGRGRGGYSRDGGNRGGGYGGGGRY